MLVLYCTGPFLLAAMPLRCACCDGNWRHFPVDRRSLKGVYSTLLQALLGGFSA